MAFKCTSIRCVLERCLVQSNHFARQNLSEGNFSIEKGFTSLTVRKVVVNPKLKFDNETSYW